MAAMGRFSTQTTVQLSALLCFIPLALENIMMQARCTADVVNVAISCIYTLYYGGCAPYCFALVMCYATPCLCAMHAMQAATAVLVLSHDDHTADGCHYALTHSMLSSVWLAVLQSMGHPLPEHVQPMLCCSET